MPYPVCLAHPVFIVLAYVKAILFTAGIAVLFTLTLSIDTPDGPCVIHRDFPRATSLLMREKCKQSSTGLPEGEDLPRTISVHWNLESGLQTVKANKRNPLTTKVIGG